MRRMFIRICVLVLAGLGLASTASCNAISLGGLTSPTSDFGILGQPTERTIRVGFVNNTPFRAIFTFGAYNQLDEDSFPTGAQQLRVEGNTSSAQFNQPCRRTFSVGGAELVRLIKENRNSPLINITDELALVDGVNFSAAPANDPLAAEPTEGTALGREVLVGVDFTCARNDIRQTTGTGLLVFTFEQDAAAPGGFRIDYQFFEP